MPAAAAANMVGIGVTSGAAAAGELYLAGARVVIGSLDALVAGLNPASSSDAIGLGTSAGELDDLRDDLVGASTTAQLVWILAPRLPEPEGMAQTDE